MLVGDEQCVDALGRTLDGRESALEIAPAEPSIDQQSRLDGLDEDGVPGAAAAEDRDLHDFP